MITLGLLPGGGHASGPPAERRPPTAFAYAVLEVVAATEPGDVLTYAEVAREAGFPGAARAVGRALHAHGSSTAWWRVVTADGRLVPGAEADHARRLAAEGVPTDGGRVGEVRG